MWEFRLSSVAGAESSVSLLKAARSRRGTAVRQSPVGDVRGLGAIAARNASAPATRELRNARKIRILRGHHNCELLLQGSGYSAQH